MSESKADRNSGMGEKRDGVKPVYVPPQIKTYTSEEILEQIGPAMACSPTPCALE